MGKDAENTLNGFMLQKFVNSVIRQAAASDNKKVLFENEFLEWPKNKNIDQRILFDIVAPNGIFNIEGTVYFEIKHNLKIDSVKNYIKQINKYFNNQYNESKATLVFITNEVIGDNPKLSEYKHYYDLQSGITYKIWGKERLDEWKEQYPIDYHNVVWANQRNKSQVGTPYITWKDFDNRSQNNLNAIKDIIKSRDVFAIVLGAGVSIEPGAKKWDDMLTFFREELEKKGLLSDYEEVKKKIGDSSLIIAQLCKDLYNPTIDYYWAIHEALYGNQQPYNTSFLLYYIVQIVKQAQHNKLFRILTYNYDEYLENYMTIENISYNSLYNSECFLNNRLSIYHVHGFLPKVEYKSYIKKQHMESIHLTETEYNSLYNNPYFWQISSQLSFFRENTCLFVGCSLSDPNIRRLLEITKTKNHAHYALLKKDNMSTTDLTRCTDHFLRLGIEVIWFNDYNELKQNLRYLYK